MDSQLKYFTNTIQVKKNLPIASVLARAGIVPGNKMYDVEDVRKALLRGVGGTPVMDCASDGVVKEVRFCLTKELKVFDCATMGNMGNCRQIIFPSV